MLQASGVILLGIGLTVGIVATVHSYIAVGVLGLLAFICSLVLEGRAGRSGSGATPPSNDVLVNTLRLEGLSIATIGVAGVLILIASKAA